MSRRYVLLGLAPARADWCREMARWASTASLPIELHLCSTAAEMRARLTAGTPCSAVVMDGRAAGPDRDLVALATTAGAATIVVDEPARAGQRCDALGATAIIPLPLERAVVGEVLERSCTSLTDLHTSPLATPSDRPEGTPGVVIAVTGTAGSGTSVTARALAEGWSAGHPDDDVLLADLALHADQALLHGIGDVVPGLPELLEEARHVAPEPTSLAEVVVHPPGAAHRLLMGLRRHRDWTRLRPRAVEGALAALRTVDLVIADCDADVEGTALTGSIEVEERNLLARQATETATLVLVTCRSATLGLARLAPTLDGLARHGIDPARTMIVVVGAPRRPRLRADLVRALHLVTRSIDGDRSTDRPPAVMVPLRSDVESAIRDSRPLPSALTRPIASSVEAVLARLTSAPAPGQPRGPEPVAAGSLGTATLS